MTVAAGVNPPPVMVTVHPPAVGPDGGHVEVTVGEPDAATPGTATAVAAHRNPPTTAVSQTNRFGRLT